MAGLREFVVQFGTEEQCIDVAVRDRRGPNSGNEQRALHRGLELVD
jgi:hypothetical protein